MDTWSAPVRLRERTPPATLRSVLRGTSRPDPAVRARAPPRGCSATGDEQNEVVFSREISSAPCEVQGLTQVAHRAARCGCSEVRRVTLHCQFRDQSTSSMFAPVDVAFVQPRYELKNLEPFVIAPASNVRLCLRTHCRHIRS